MVINIDGSQVTDITIDGDPVQEVTIDGSVAWTRFIEDWNDGTTGWSDTDSTGSVGTQTAEPVSNATYFNTSPAPSDVYGYAYRSSAGYTAAENTNITLSADTHYEFFLRSGAGTAGTSESQFQFLCQSSGGGGDRYRVAIFNGADEVDLDKYSGGSKSTLDTNGNVTVSGTEWCKVQMKTPPSGGGTIEARIKNISTDGGPWTVSATDSSPYTSGHIRISTYDGGGGNRTDMDGLRKISGFTL